MANELPAIDDAIREGHIPQAIALLRHYFEKQPSLATAAQVIDRVNGVRSALCLRSARVMFARSMTIEPMLPLLQAGAMLQGLDLNARVGAFNSYAQEILDPGSELYRFDPDIVFLAVQTRDVLPELWYAQAAPERAESLIERVLDDVASWIQRIRSCSRAGVVIFNFEMPSFPFGGLLDAQGTESQSASIASLNRRLREVATREGAYVLDYDALIARHGRIRWHDERKWMTARMPIAATYLPRLAEECLRFAVAMTGCTRKALIVDLDNTLWGGILGEDGMHGVQLGPEYPGAAYLALQRVLLAFYERGVILAIASKNNPADAAEMLENHPEMMLRMGHFAATRIGWQDKVTSVAEIAAELNIGLDSCAFLDDNPVEQARIRRELPDVLVLEATADPLNNVEMLVRCPSFERLALSAEDRDRGQQYAEQRRRGELRQASGSMEDFYRSLDMVMTIEAASPATIGRVAQLTQKTNQFNLTTRRYSEDEIRKLSTDSCYRLFTYRLRDRFGDNGLVGVAILHTGTPSWAIETLLMSCRVIGRTMETAMLAHVLAEAKTAGARTLCGWYLHTPKNEPARDVYAKHQFHLIDEQGQNSLWEFDVAASFVQNPPWISLAEGS